MPANAIYLQKGCCNIIDVDNLTSYAVVFVPQYTDLIKNSKLDRMLDCFKFSNHIFVVLFIDIGDNIADGIVRL